MTYCAAMKLDRGLVFGADTRTNAGVDNVSKTRKMHVWTRVGERVIVLLSSGNLGVSQSVVSLLNEQVAAESARGDAGSLLKVPSLYRAARLVGETLREIRAVDGPSLEATKAGFAASFILGGQIGEEPPRLFEIYREGNFIEATHDSPFVQIGEHKYGKPILDRVARTDMRLEEAAKLLLLSFDSTLRSNLSVGMPLDFLIYERDSFSSKRQERIEDNDDYFAKLSGGWSDALRSAFAQIDDLDW